MKLFKLFLLGAMVLGLSACASGVKRSAAMQGYQYNGQKFSSVVVRLNATAQEKLKDNIKFDPKRFEGVLQRTFESRGLMSKSSKNQIEVLVTDVRVRSTFSAVMWGFLAGGDSIDGMVKSNVISGTSIPEFEVSASYALGGWGVGQDDSRVNWLYEEFSKLTVNEILGQNDDEEVAYNQ